MKNILMCALLFSLMQAPNGRAAEPTTLHHALMDFHWTFTDSVIPNGKPVDLVFRPDGVVIVSRSNGTTGKPWQWTITGPRTAHIQWPNNTGIDVKFNDALAQFTFKDKFGLKTGVRGITTAVAPTPAVPLPAIQTDPNQPRVEVLKEQAPNATEWALTPLDQAVPADIRQNLTFLREDLLDEGKQGPKARPEAYKLGEQLCNALLAILEERNQSLARVGFNTAIAKAPVGVTSQALEARRNYMMSWPQYAREQAQRAELRNTATNNAIVLAERPKLEWVQRTDQFRPTVEKLYAQFREALRESPAAK